MNHKIYSDDTEHMRLANQNCEACVKIVKHVSCINNQDIPGKVQDVLNIESSTEKRPQNPRSNQSCICPPSSLSITCLDPCTRSAQLAHYFQWTMSVSYVIFYLRNVLTC